MAVDLDLGQKDNLWPDGNGKDSNGFADTIGGGVGNDTLFGGMPDPQGV